MQGQPQILRLRSGKQVFDLGSRFPTLAPEKGRKDGARSSLAEQRKSKCKDNRRSFDFAQENRSLIWVRGFPPLRQKKGAKMGHGVLLLSRGRANARTTADPSTSLRKTDL